MDAFAKFDNVIDKLSGMDKALKDFADDILDDPEVNDFMIKMNIKQMDAGKDANNMSIVPDYTERTVAIKQKKGQIYSRVTLEDTGDFKGAMKTQNRGNKIDFYSEDSKSEMLQAKYGPAIFGLNEKNIQVLRSYLKPNFKIFLSNYIKS